MREAQYKDNRTYYRITHFGIVEFYSVPLECWIRSARTAEEVRKLPRVIYGQVCA